MTIIGTDEEIKEIKHQCDGRCLMQVRNTVEL